MNRKTVIGFVAAAVFLIACGGAAETTGDTPVETSSPIKEEQEVSYTEPKPKHFELKVKELRKECFGTAGCHVEFRINLEIIATGISFDPDKSWEIIYKVTGGDQEYTNWLDFYGDGSYSTDDVQFISTPSEGSKLKAKITDIEVLW